MFETGNYVVCGQHGVCRVECMGPLKLTEVSGDRIYYTLSQVYSQSGVIYVPADSDKIIMRPVISREEAGRLIDEMEDMDMLWVETEKKREDVFKQALRSCDIREWVRIIKTLYARKQERLARGKKVTASDERFLHAAEENLYGELAVSLGKKKEEIEEYIINRIEKRKVDAVS